MPNNSKLAVIFLAVIVILLTPTAFAHSVTMNFRFHITDLSDTIHLGTNYISSERDNTLAALIFAGTALSEIILDKNVDPYIFKITQDENQNSFLLALTNSTWEKIDAKQNKIPAATFGDLSQPTVIANNIALQLQFDTIDLTGIFSQPQLLIKSLGKQRLPVVNIGTV